MRIQSNDNNAVPNDVEFFTEFYTTYKNFMYYLALKFASSPSECEDIVQEALVRLLCNIESLKKLNEHKLRSYIGATIKTAYLDCQYHENRIQHLFIDDDFVQYLLKDNDKYATCMPDLFPKLEVEKLKNTLEPRDWLILEGKYILGYSQEELSELLHIAPDSIRMTLVRARKRAREILSLQIGGTK